MLPTSISLSSDGLIDNQRADSPLEKTPNVGGARLILEKRTIVSSGISSVRLRRAGGAGGAGGGEEEEQVKRNNPNKEPADPLSMQQKQIAMLLVFLPDADFSFLLYFGQEDI